MKSGYKKRIGFILATILFIFLISPWANAASPNLTNALTELG